MDQMKRAVNFSQKAILLLLQLVKKHAAVLECKRTDAVSNRQKTETWLKLADEFNAVMGEVARSAAVLRGKYENIKKKSKKKFADAKIHSKGTGGGPPVFASTSSVDNTVLEILGTRMTGNQSFFDDDQESDAELINTENVPVLEGVWVEEDIGDLNEEEEEEEEVEEEEAVLNEPVPSTDWRHHTATDLRRPKTSVLCRKKTRDSMCEWAGRKAQLAENEKKNDAEEHNMKMKIMKEKWRKELEIMERESAVKVRMWEEMHELKMEMLLLVKEKLLKK